MEMKKENITPRNSKRDRHGYWEVYKHNGTLWYKGNYNNGKKYGLWYRSGILFYKLYYNHLGNTEGIGITYG